MNFSLLTGNKFTAHQISNRLTADNLHLAAQQANSATIMVSFVLIALVYLYRNLLDGFLILCLAAIITAYLSRAWLAHSYLKLNVSIDKHRPWLVGFTVVAALSGLLWGITLSLIISRQFPGLDLFLTFLISALTAGAIPSLGAIFIAYASYLVGILAPVLVTFIINGTESGYMLGALTIVYFVFLLVTAGKFRKKHDIWHQRSIVNEKFSNNLIEEKRRSDQSVVSLEDELSRHRRMDAAIKHHRLMQANSKGDLAAMTYRAVNDGDWTLESIGKGSKKLLGLSAKELKRQGKNCLYELLTRSPGSRKERRSLKYDDGFSYQYEYVLQTPLAKERRVVEYGHRIFDEMGLLKAVEGIVSDIEENYQALAEAEHLSSTDHLTDLPSRAHFEAVVEDALATLDRDEDTHSLLFVDLDCFETVNLSSNYAVGNNIIRQVTGLLHDHSGQKNAFIARLGSDEFGILLEHCMQKDGVRIAEELCSAIDSMKFRYREKSFNMSASIGVASTEHELHSLQDLLCAADKALHLAKQNGRNRVEVYDAENQSVIRLNEELQLEMDKRLL